MENHQRNQLRIGGFTLIFMLMSFMLNFIPFFIKNEFSIVLLLFSYFFVMLALIYFIKSPPILRSIEYMSLLLIIIFNALTLYHQSVFYLLFTHVFSLFFFVIICCELIKKIVYSDEVNTNLIFGALITYFLFGIIWSKIYFIQNVFAPGSFASSTIDFKHMDFKEAITIQFNLLYYSFTTLTTLGIGDIVPVHNQAKVLSWLEAIFGQIYLVTIISKLVATWHFQFYKKNAK